MDEATIARLVGMIMIKLGVDEVKLTREELIHYNSQVESVFDPFSATCTIKLIK
ncbi:hypothetical protein SEA_UZUMAKI_62 [Arthrobacter phage Uzumaki]|nr:hypothetical protein SEA_UZUMAKI_62 [Arthrobacter phage Uzumaki]